MLDNVIIFLSICLLILASFALGLYVSDLISGNASLYDKIYFRKRKGE